MDATESPRIISCHKDQQVQHWDVLCAVLAGIICSEAMGFFGLVWFFSKWKTVSSYSLTLGMATNRCYREVGCAQIPGGNFPIHSALWGLLSQALQLHHGLVLGFEPFQS